MFLPAITTKPKQYSTVDFKGRHYEAALIPQADSGCTP
jgi:hypothetical protein